MEEYFFFQHEAPEDFFSRSLPCKQHCQGKTGECVLTQMAEFWWITSPVQNQKDGKTGQNHTIT